jgi:hypothetical protein
MADDKKQQFNVYLPPDLIREVKHAAVDSGKSLSAFLEDVLRAHLKQLKTQSESDQDSTTRPPQASGTP